jgi:hypothetical protein
MLVLFLMSHAVIKKLFVCILLFSSDNQKVLFRANSIATKAMEAYMKLVGQKVVFFFFFFFFFRSSGLVPSSNAVFLVCRNGFLYYSTYASVIPLNLMPTGVMETN